MPENKFEPGDSVVVINSNRKTFMRIGIVEEMLISGVYAVGFILDSANVILNFRSEELSKIEDILKPDDLVIIHSHGCHNNKIARFIRFEHKKLDLCCVVAVPSEVSSSEFVVRRYPPQYLEIYRPGVGQKWGAYRYQNTNQLKGNKQEMAVRSLEIKEVKFNPPATIIFWKDGTKTVVKAENEPFDPEKGMAMAIAKRVISDKGNYYETFKKWLPDQIECHAPNDEKTGHWIVENEESIRCSECCFNRARLKFPMDYCPNCGARMAAKAPSLKDFIADVTKKEVTEDGVKVTATLRSI